MPKSGRSFTKYCRGTQSANTNRGTAPSVESHKTEVAGALHTYVAVEKELQSLSIDENRDNGAFRFLKTATAPVEGLEPIQGYHLVGLIE